MKILIVTHSYAPDPMPRAYRWTAIAEHWAARGATVDVLTTGGRGGPARETRGGVCIRRVGERLLGALRRSSARSRPIVRAATEGSRSDTPSRLARLARIVYRASWKQLQWPDYACPWYFSAARQARRLCRETSYDAVITVSHPFTGHLVGLAVKRALPSVRWLVDVGDPFSLVTESPMNNRRLYAGLNRWIDGRVFTRCDAITVTVEGCRAVFADAFPVTRDRTHVIPPLLSLPRADGPADAPFGTAGEAGGEVHLVYLGRLYADIRPPDALLSLFARLFAREPRLRLQFYGDIGDCGEAFARYPDLFGTAILTHGPVPREKVASIMSAADVLVNIGNDTAHQLPSKLVEYVSAARPILNIGRGDDDTARAFLAGHPSALHVAGAGDASDRARTEEVLRFVTDPPPIGREAIDAFVARFRIENIAGAYARLIEDMR